MSWITRQVEKNVDIDKELGAIIDYFSEAVDDVRLMGKLLADMKKLRNELAKIKKGTPKRDELRRNILEQVMKWDEVLRQYMFIDSDIEVNAVRARMIGHQLKKTAKHVKIDGAWLDKIETQDRWVFEW